MTLTEYTTFLLVKQTLIKGMLKSCSSMSHPTAAEEDVRVSSSLLNTDILILSPLMGWKIRVAVWLLLHEPYFSLILHLVH